MARIPLAQQPSIFQPQNISAHPGQFRAQEQAITAKGQAFSALNNLLTGTAKVALKLNEEQLQADKVVGSNQIQNSLRKLQEDATLKFPGDYKSQQQFVNNGAKSFLTTFIQSARSENRNYFKAVSANVMSEANFKYARNIGAQNLKNQRSTLNTTFESNLVNSVEAVRNGNTPLAQDNIGQVTKSLQGAVDGSLITPQEAQIYKQKLLMAVNIAGAKTHIDGALAHGGIDGANAKFREIVSDKNNRLLADPKTASSFISQLRSYKNAITSGLKASQSANRDQIRDIVNNARLNGTADVSKVSQFDIQDQVLNAINIHDKAKEIFSLPPLQRQEALSKLNLADPNDKAIQQTFGDFNTAYKKDKMNWLQNQLSQEQLGTSIANATPEQKRQIRSAAVQFQQQRGDVNIKPATQLDMQPVISAAKTGDPQLFTQSLNSFNQSMGKYNKQAGIQLSRELTKNGVNQIIEDLPHLGPNNEDVAQNIAQSSIMDKNANKLTAANRLDLSEQKFTVDLKSASQSAMSPTLLGFSLTNKMVDSIKNSAGANQGQALGELNQNLQTYITYAVANGKAATMDQAASQYMNSYINSFNYMHTANGLQIRIPKQYLKRPVDQNTVRTFLKAKKNSLGFRDFDLSDVAVNPLLGSVTSQARWWNTVGNLKHWANMPGGDSWVLVDNQNKQLTGKDGNPVIVHLDDIIGRK